MKRHAFILALMAFLSMPATADADIYRWKDAKGVMHFSNQPPPGGVTVIERIEEAPYDPQAERRRIEEERRLRFEKEKLDIQAREAETELREREAQLKLEDADRRLEEARLLEQEAIQRTKADDCEDGYYLRYGVCVGYPPYSVGRHFYGPPGRADLYRGYYRENNSLYYKHPGKPLQRPPTWRPREKPATRSETSKNAAKAIKTPRWSPELLLKGSGQTPASLAAPK